MRVLAGLCATMLVELLSAGPAGAVVSGNSVVSVDVAGTVQGSTEATAPRGPGSSSGFFTYGGGSSLEGTGPIADFPAGMYVWVLAGTRHVSEMRQSVAYAVSQLRRYGIDVVFRGLAKNVTAVKGPGDVGSSGTILVTEKVHQPVAPCNMVPGSGSRSLAEGVTKPFTEQVGAVKQIDASAVTFCPDVWARGLTAVTDLALHEMGHAVGLGHFRGTYRGGAQVMNPVASALTAYQPGDINGLRYIAAQTARLNRQSVPRGAIEGWDVTSDGLTIRGWALTGQLDQATEVEITRDGTPIYTDLTNIPRPDIVLNRDGRWADAGFFVHLPALAGGVHTYCAIAVDRARPTARHELGCRRLAPAPTPSATSAATSAGTPSGPLTATPSVGPSVGPSMAPAAGHRSVRPVLGYAALAVLLAALVCAAAIYARRRRR